MIQQFVNSLGSLSPASVRLAYKVLRQSLEKAVKLEYISRNPAADCELPRAERTEIHPLSDEQAAALLQAVKGSRFRATGLRGPVHRLPPLGAAGSDLGLRGLYAWNFADK